MTITLYDLAGSDGRRFSPYCWRTRMALAHKGLQFETIPVRFTDKPLIAFSGQERVPVIRDGDRTVYDSWTIAAYLEDTYPDTPTLFGGSAGRGLARFVNGWTDRALHASLIRLVIADILDHVDPADREYFIESRTKRFGAAPEAVQTRSPEDRKAFDGAVAVIRAALDGQDFLSGPTPLYADYIVFGAFAWSRTISPYALLEFDDPVYAWRERMLALFGELAGNAVGYPV